MIFQAYADDSGTKGAGPVMVIAAIIGPAEAWAEVSDAWDKELRGSKHLGRIGYFKESEAYTLAGEFQHWGSEARDKKVERLAKIVDRSDLFIAWYGLDLDAHQAASKFVGKPLKNNLKRHGGNQPYLLLMPTVIMAIAVSMRQRSPESKIEMFLDEHEVFKPDILAGYSDMLRAVETIYPNVRERMPKEPWFRDDKEFLPIQAADLIAGGLRRHIINESQYLKPLLTKIRWWPGSKVINDHDMSRFAQRGTTERLVEYRVPRPQRKKTKKR